MGGQGSPSDKIACGQNIGALAKGALGKPDLSARGVSVAHTRALGKTPDAGKARIWATGVGMAAAGKLFAIGLATLFSAAWLPEPVSAAELCKDVDAAGHAYTICTVDTAKDHLGLFWKDSDGKPFGTFDQLATSLAQTRRTLVFAMNAGMFQTDLSPVGLYVEGGAQRHAANTREGPGNFHLKPNGVFYVGQQGAGIKETQRFLDAHLHPDFATQSGPMLVIDGAIHPKIQADGTSLKIRNGVGVRDGHLVFFAISRDPVSFYAFASLFRDTLGCRDALFLDGTISSLYAPSLGRRIQWLPVGPILGVTEPQS